MTPASSKIDFASPPSSTDLNVKNLAHSKDQEVIQNDLEVTWRVSSTGKTPLHEAVEKNDPLEVQKWTAQCPFWVNQQDQKGKTPLFYVRGLEIWKTLRSNGAKWDIPDQRGRTVWDRAAKKIDRREVYIYFILDMIRSDEFRGRRDRAELLGQIPKIYDPTLFGSLIHCLAEEGFLGEPHLEGLLASPYSSSSEDTQKLTFSPFLYQLFDALYFDWNTFLDSLEDDTRKKLPNLSYLAVMMGKYSFLDIFEKAGFILPGIESDQLAFPLPEDKDLRALCACFDLAKTDEEKYRLARLFSQKSALRSDAAYQEQSIFFLKQLNSPEHWEKQLRRSISCLHHQDTIAWIHKYEEAWSLDLHQGLAKKLLSRFAYHFWDRKQEELKAYVTFVIEKSDEESLDEIEAILIDRLSAMRSRKTLEPLVLCLFFLRTIANRRVCLGDFEEGKEKTLFIQALLPILAGWEDKDRENLIKHLSHEELESFLYQLYCSPHAAETSPYLRRQVVLHLKKCFKRVNIPALSHFCAVHSIPQHLTPLFLLIIPEMKEAKSRVDAFATLFKLLGESEYTKSLLKVLSSEELEQLYLEHPQDLAGVSFFSSGEKGEQYETLNTFIRLQKQLSWESKLHLRQWLKQWDFSTESHLGWIFRYLPVLRDSDFELKGLPMNWAILLNLAKRHPEMVDGIFTPNRPIQRLEAPLASRFIQNLFEFPHQWSPFVENLLKTKVLSVGVDLHAHSTFGDFADWLLAAVHHPSLSLTPPLAWEKKTLETAYEKKISVKHIQPCDAPFVHSSGVRILGRTVVYPDAKRGGWTAYKFRRADEPVSEFAREFFITKAMEQCDFPSELPQFEEFLWIKHCPLWIREKIQSLPKSDSQLVLRFHAPDGYYNYLNEIKDEETWRKGREKWLKTQAKKMKLGYAPIEAPLYHGKGRHYEPLTDLMRTITQGKTHRNDGAGFVLDPRENIQKPNCGETGARDHGDLYHIEDLLKKDELQSIDVKMGTDDVYREPFILLSVPAKTLLVDALLVIDRFIKIERSDRKDEELVEEIAKAFQEGQAWFIEGFTGRSKRECDSFSKSGLIHWKQMARQLLLWLNHGEEGYVPYLRSKKVPEGLYDSDTRVSINIREGDYDENGFVVKDGKESLGCQHGSILAVELEKYLMLTALVVHGL